MERTVKTNLFQDFLRILLGSFMILAVMSLLNREGK